jgi:hypothetical protein
MKKLLLLICSLGSLLVGAAAHAAVGFTLSPSIITNGYEGTINLNITGLGVGQTIVVRVYGDLMVDGLIQAGSPLMLDFTVTDGQVPLIGGVRNPNVPGDEDGLTNGQIQVRLPYPTLDETVSPAAIRSIVQVSDPLGGFTPTNLPFRVVQKIYPQGVTGRVTAVTTNGSQLPYTLVGISSVGHNLPGSQFTVTDTNGYFTIYALPDTYTVQVVSPGFASDQNLTVTVPCGQMVTDNVAALTAGLTLSGKVTDAGTGKGIPGVAVTAKTTNNLNVATFTDTNGNYSLPVIPTNLWRVRVYQPMLSEAGYVALAIRTNVNVGNLNVSGINFSFSKATALIHGTITDQYGNPVIGTGVLGSDAALPQHEADGGSFAPDGSYALGVIGGTWTLGQAPDQLALLGLTGVTGTNVTLADGQVMQANFVYVRTNFPKLSSPSHPSAGQAQFFLNGLGAQNYLIQYSTNLGSSNWSSLLTTNGGCAPVPIIDSQATNGNRFYRALIVP